MFVHSVYFWLQNPQNEADRDALNAGLQTLKTIDAVSTVYVGRPAETRRPVIDHSYDFALTLVFTDKAAHDVYQEHPTHLQFVADCSHLWNRVQIYDSVE
ncbi:Dabb family protein [Rudanella lutea]|uniref:Dabb family protein n=1 Tax=Rudanella lutea TaxID=451374 RepID=UPI00036D783D|nr:Dabb family protein [Rudanella lutea]